MEKFTAKIAKGLTTEETQIPNIEDFVEQEIVIYKEIEDDPYSWTGELPNGFGTWSWDNDWLTDITPLSMGSHSDFDYE
jgi:hypothetical protein